MTSRRAHALSQRFRLFGGNTAASVAVWFAVALVPIVYGLGAAVDYSRSVNFKQQLQNAADSAALAGAEVYTDATQAAAAQTVAQKYMANFVTAMGATWKIVPTVTTSAVVNGTKATLYAVTVTATGSVTNSIMAGFGNAATGVKVTAKAENPIYTLSINLTSIKSDSYDLDMLSYYIVPSDNGVPASSTPVYSNISNTNPSLVTMQVAASQKIGFLLNNKTGYKTYYSPNGHGGVAYSSHTFYSHMFPPSIIAYPGVTQNCSLQVSSSGPSGATGCSNALPTNAAINCVKIAGTTWTYSWNDMGGIKDDYDYNDLVYNVSCSQNDTSLPAGVVLVQ